MIEASTPTAPDAKTDEVKIAVVGAHLSGMPLNVQLVDLAARFVSPDRTAPLYRLFDLAGSVPPKPGLLRVSDGSGAQIEVEIWALSHDAYGRFVSMIPSPLCIGTIELESGPVQGFLVEPYAVDGSPDITAHGGWRAYMSQKA
ncbi:hypothetical protein [Psychromarinibacter halotolerans]|uniref:Allophanate hydrolase C-terminal domain-containing protein n=1 Tax=Psychromarinibacter halotolerans TaxID=1775175 RepID=A0ABV7GR90_9RHOB